MRPSYKAILSQTGTNAPVEDVIFENTTGVTFTYSYVGIGSYSVLASSPLNNLFIQATNKSDAVSGTVIIPCIKQTQPDTFTIEVFDGPSTSPVDGWELYVTIEDFDLTI